MCFRVINSFIIAINTLGWQTLQMLINNSIQVNNHNDNSDYKYTNHTSDTVSRTRPEYFLMITANPFSGTRQTMYTCIKRAQTSHPLTHNKTKKTNRQTWYPQFWDVDYTVLRNVYIKLAWNQTVGIHWQAFDQNYVDILHCSYLGSGEKWSSAKWSFSIPSAVRENLGYSGPNISPALLNWFRPWSLSVCNKRDPKSQLYLTKTSALLKRNLNVTKPATCFWDKILV